MTFKSQPKLKLEIDSPEVGYLNMRSQPSTSGELITRVSHGATVTPLEPDETVRAKVGQHGEWLHVRLDDGREVYAAAWYLKLFEEPAEPPTSELKVWIHSPEFGYLNIRKAPSTSGTPITQVQHGASLVSLEAEADVQAKVGKQGEWLKVRLDDGQEGYGAAFYFSLTSARAPETELEPPAEQKIAITSDLDGTERQVALAWNRLGGLLQTLADKLGIDPGVAVAVLTVESGGRAFGPAGRMIIRFENQIFYDQWGENNPDTFAQHFVYNSNQRWTGHQWRPAPDQAWRSFHGDQDGEWEVFEFACTLDDTAAKSSISMGGPQIMGFNYAAIGYTSVQQMFDAFAESECDQVTGFFNFVRSRGTNTVQMLQNLDFGGFARVYNGPGQATHYGNLIRKAYDAYKLMQAPEPVSFGISAKPADKPAKKKKPAAPVSFGISAAKAGIKVKVVSPEVGYLNVRAGPSTGKALVAKVDDGTILEALEPEADVRAKVGQQGQWLQVRTPDGTEGYTAAWYLAKASLEVKVVSPEVGFLRIRPTPSTDQPAIAQVNDGVMLEALEPETDVRTKIGQQDQWLRVRTPDGVEGYTAAWYLQLPEKAPVGVETIPLKPVTPGTPTPRIVVNSDTGLNVRQGPGTQTPITWHIENKTVLEVLEDPAQAGGKVGKDHWIQVRTPSLHEGYVNGEYVHAEQLADKRQPVDPASVPQGESAWIFGIHGAGATTPVDFRFLFEGKGKTGWVLFTEAIGDNPNHGGGHDYTPWSGAGYGVIVRLNNGYEPAGTIPISSKYADFAKACARYVQNSKGCWIWIVGNEQNNVREHPGGAEHPTEHITPQLFAKAFNLARQRIKEVDPNAQVVLGAVDPYNTYPWAKMGNKRNRPLEYYKEMLSHVDDLDGIALHTYTHWMDVSLITSKEPFTDEFLKPGTVHEHYYDFYAYRPFAEAIPDKWRDRPVYITESNHWLALDHRPRNPQEEAKIGWVNKDIGWVQAAYAEINRWNNTPHVPQIHCLLLYRWTGDAWAIENLGEIHKDFKKALDHDYRWRR